MDFNEIEKAYAMGRAYAMGLKHAKLMAKLNTVAQDTMKDGFATLVDSEGQPYVANLNPKEKERYSETKKPLSQVKKEEKAKKEQEQKEAEERARKEAEVKKKAEEEAKKKGTSEKLNFKDRLKELLDKPFKKRQSSSYIDPHEFDKERVEKTFSKLDPNDEKSQKALNELEDAMNEGSADKVSAICNSVSTYTADPKGYERSLKASERSLEKTYNTFNELQKKLRDKFGTEIEKIIPQFQKEIKDLTGKNIDYREAQTRLNQTENKFPGFLYRQYKKDIFKVMYELKEGKDLAKNIINHIKDHNPADGLKGWIELKKKVFKGYKDNVKEFFNKNNLAMDSAEFKEIQSMLDDLLTDFDL